MEGDSCYWTMDGTIDKVRSLKEIINNTKSLSVEEKNFNSLYRLACRHCLEEHIPDLCLKVVDNDEFDYEVYRHYSYHFIAYWNAAIVNNLPSFLEKLRRYDSKHIYDFNLSINEIMATLSVYLRNEIGFKYFWYKLTEQEKIANIEKWTVLAINGINCNLLFYGLNHHYGYQEYEAGTHIMCFLLSHLDSQRKQKEIFQTHSEKILISLFQHWPLQRFFLTTIAVMFDFLQDKVYVRVMSAISGEIREKRKTEMLLREVWRLSPLRLKKVFIHFLMAYASLIVHLIELEDDITLDMILNYASTIEKKQIVFRMIKDVTFHDLLSLGKSAFLVIDTFVSKILSSDSDLLLFKRSVALEHADRLRCALMHDNASFQATRKLLNWALQSENEICEFKKNHIDPMPIYSSLMHSFDCEPVNGFMHWYFETEEEIFKFKKTFVHKVPCSGCTRMLGSLYHHGKDGWIKFEKFLSYGFISSEDIPECKKYVLDVAKFQANTMDQHSLEFATLCLNWCLDSSDEVILTKMELLDSEHAVMYYVRGCPDINWEEVKRVLEWFSPLSTEVITKLKSELLFNIYADETWEEYEEKRVVFFDLLDSFVKKGHKPESEL